MTDRSEMWKGLHIGTTMSSFVICGALLIWTGLLEMDLASGALGVDATAGALASLSLSIVLAALSFGSVRTDHITSGLTMLYIALSSATRSVSSIALGTWDMPVIELTYSIPLVAFVVVSFSRGRYMATAASVMLLTSNVLSSTLRDETSMWFSDLLMVASGLLFLIFGLFGSIRKDRVGGRFAKHIPERDRAYETVVIVGLLMMGTQGLISAFSVYDGTMFASTFVICACTLAIGLYGICKGILLESIMIMTYSAASVMFAVGNAVGAGFMITDTFCAIIMAVCGALMVLRRQYFTGMAALAFGILAAPGVIIGTEWCWRTGALMMSAVILIYAVSRWIYKESGMVVIPISSADGPLRYPHYSSLGRFAVAPTAGTFSLALLCLTSACNSPWAMEILGLDQVSTGALTMMCSFLAIAFAVVSMWARMITESILMLLMGVMTLIMSMSAVTTELTGFVIANLFFISGFATCAFIFKKRGQSLRFAACAVVCVTLLASSLPTGHSAGIFGIGYLACGSLFLLSAVWKTYKVCVLKKKYELDCPRMHQSPVEYAHSLVSTAGVLMFAILSLVLGYYVIDGDSSLYLVKIVMSVITMGFGLYALSRGIATEGMMMYAVAMITIVTSAAHIVHIPDTEYLGMVVSFVFIPLAYRFAREGDWMMSIASALLFAMFFLGPFVSDAAYLEVIVAALKAVSCVMAITSIVRYETGTRLFRGLFMSKESHGHGGHASRMNSASHLTIGIIAVWCGMNYLLVATGHQTDATAYHFVRVALCLFALPFVLDLLRDGKLTEALMNMYIGLSVLAFSLVTLFFDTGGALPMEIVFAVGIAMTAAIFIFRRNWALATTAGGMALVYLIPPLTGTAETVPLGVIALVAGAALMVYSMLGAILGEKGERILERDRARFAVDSGKDYSILLVATSGMFTASMVGLDSSLFDMSIAFCVPGLFLSAVTCVAALYSMFHGRPGTCMYLLSMALVSATWDTAVILGAEADPMVISIGAFLLLTSVFPLVLRGFRVLAATAALSSVAIVLGILTGTEAVWTAGLIIYSVMTLAYAVNRWIGGEIGRAPLPTMV